MLDSTYVRVHQHGCGARPRGLANAIGPSRGGRTTKIHVATVDGDRIRRLVVTAGNIADISVAPALAQGLVSGGVLIADKAYDSDAFTESLHHRRIKVVIPSRTGRLRPRSLNKRLYRLRNAVERLFAHLKHARRIASRFDKTVASYTAFVYVAHMLLVTRRKVNP